MTRVRSARRLVLAKRVVVRSAVGAFVGVVILVPAALLLATCGLPPPRLGAEGLLAFPAAGALLMNLFGGSRPARVAVRAVRRVARAAERTAA